MWQYFKLTIFSKLRDSKIARKNQYFDELNSFRFYTVNIKINYNDFTILTFVLKIKLCATVFCYYY